MNTALSEFVRVQGKATAVLNQHIPIVAIIVQVVDLSNQLFGIVYSHQLQFMDLSQCASPPPPPSPPPLSTLSAHISNPGYHISWVLLTSKGTGAHLVLSHRPSSVPHKAGGRHCLSHPARRPASWLVSISLLTHPLSSR